MYTLSLTRPSDYTLSFRYTRKQAHETYFHSKAMEPCWGSNRSLLCANSRSVRRSMKEALEPFWGSKQFQVVSEHDALEPV